MKKILLQLGHYNTQNNCDPRFRGMTGAPDEVAHNYAIGIKLAELLNMNGYEAHVTDANINCPSNLIDANKDWDLFLALHCDSNYSGDEGGGFVDYIDLSIDSSLESNTESKRIKEAIESEYFIYTGIRNVPSRSNANTKFYYAWQYLTAKTPCVILEMGESVDPHDSVILNDVTRVAIGILKGIQKAFPVAIQPQPTPPINEIEALKKEVESLKGQIVALKTDYEARLAQKEQVCQKQTTEALAKFAERLIKCAKTNG